jgi:2-amino-4-hydroxy-6-hydroxymethyldihydropteridine diphosphokinase
MATIYLLLGTNLGERNGNLKECISFMEDGGIHIMKRSGVYETDAWGFEEQPSFFNQAVEAETSLSPQQLLAFLKSIEKNMGRINNQRWQERLIDIDILYYDKEIINTETLVIPHSELPNRRFALIPLIEIAAGFVHPVLNKTNVELLNFCRDKLQVKRLE